jgi:hypothetical protein
VVGGNKNALPLSQLQIKVATELGLNWMQQIYG